MSAFAEAQKLYKPKELGQIIAECAKFGFVYSDPETFICAYPVHSNDTETRYKIELDKCDAWFIFIASGDLKKAFDVIPQKKHIAFERFDGKVRTYEFDRFRRIHGWEHNG